MTLELNDNFVDVAVVGGGPAGAMTALLLARRGFRVRLHRIRPGRRIVEGISLRALERIAHAGVPVPEDGLSAPVPRFVSWGGPETATNQEVIVDRLRFDEALFATAVAAGVQLVEGRVSGSASPERLGARYVVEARGRRAPRNQQDVMRGPSTVALARPFRARELEPSTRIMAVDTGWIWMAADGSGQVWVQVIVDPGERLLRRGELDDVFMDTLRSAPGIGPIMRKAEPLGAVTARDATPVLAGTVIDDACLRVGDAASAIDPLSGHGLYEAVSGAHAVAAAIATWLLRPEDRELVKDFHAGRVRADFLRHAAIGRRFYTQMESFARYPFWLRRREWPDRTLVPEGAVEPTIVTAPVVVNGFIERRPVVVTREHPRGILSIADVPLVLLLEKLKAGETGLAAVFGVSEEALGLATAWLRREKLI